MKSLSAVLLLVTAISGWAQLTTSTRLRPGKMPEDARYTFAVEIGSTNASLHLSASNMTTINFRVSIARKAPERTAVVEADLITFDGESEIHHMPATNLQTSDAGYLYEFVVATDLLTYSQFVFRERIKGRHGGSVDGNSFWFFLKDFVPTARPITYQARAVNREKVSSTEIFTFPYARPQSGNSDLVFR